jgi:protein SCO1/2
MSRERRIALAAAGAVLVLGMLVTGVVLALLGGTGSAVGGPLPLVDHTGKRLETRDTEGRPKIVFFGFTHCPEVCPTTLAEISALLDRLGPEAGRLGAYFVSVDPERDRPEVLAGYLSSFNPAIRGLTGTPEEVAAVARAYRVVHRKVPLDGGGYTVDHSAVIYLFDASGRFVQALDLGKPDAALAAVRRVLA